MAGRSGRAVSAVCIWLCTALALCSERDVRAAEPSDSAVTAPLRLRDSRSAPVWWEAAQQQLKQGQTAGALALLEQLQREAADQFILEEPTSSTAEWLVRQLIEQLSPENRRTWDAAVAPRSRAAWDRWQTTREIGDLQWLCRAFGPTEPGLRAWQTLAAIHRDEGRREHALVAYDAVIHHPRATKQERATAILSEAVLWHELGRPDRVQALWQRHQAEFASLRVSTAGRIESLAAAFDRLHHSLNDAERDVAVPLDSPWQRELAMPEALQSLWDEWQPEFRAAGVWMLPANEPLLVGENVISRTLTGVVAWRQTTGEPRWQTPPSQEFGWIQTNPGMLDNRGYRSRLVWQLYPRLLANSVLGRLTTNGRLVFSVHDPRGLGYGSTSDHPPEWPGSSEPRFNILAAYRADTGELAWRVGGESAGPTYALAGAYFCGPPTPMDDMVLVVAQVGAGTARLRNSGKEPSADSHGNGPPRSELRLLALSAEHGELVWSVHLGETHRPLPEDSRRQRVACPVVLQEGVLLCPTAAGAVVAVDPLTRVPRWAYRYPVESRMRAVDPRDNRLLVAVDHWWDGWRDITLTGTGTLLVFASPESSRLHALEARTGRLRWTIPRDGGLVLIGTAGDRVLVAEPTAIRAHHLDTGELAWRTPIGELTGRPMILGDRLVVPAQPDGLVSLQLVDGRIVPSTGSVTSPVGNLTHSAHGHFTASVSSVGKLAERAATDDREARWRSAIAELASHPEQWNSVQASIPKLAESVVQRFELQLAVARAAAQAGQWRDAAQQLLTLSDRASRDEFLVRFNPRRLVRADLAVVATWDDLERSASTAESGQLRQWLKDSWDKACAGTDPFAPQRWRERWQPLSFAQEPNVLSESRVFLGLPIAAVELAFLSAGDPALLWQLGEELSRAGFRREADDYRRLLLRNHAGALLPNGMTVATALQRIGEPKPMRDPWPTVAPQVESQKGLQNDNVHHNGVPLDLESTPLFEHLDITIDRQGRRLRFSGGGQRRAWELALPQLAPMQFEGLRHNQEMVQGWGRGRLMILRVGANLFAVTPFDDGGEPAARVVWSLSMLDGSVLNPGEQILPSQPDPRDGSVRQLDPFGRSVGQVGPVRAAFLCYHQGGRLICIETLTGHKRWERYDLPLNAVTYGDDEVVLIWSPNERKLEWVRAIDGATLGQRSWPASSDELVLQRDRRSWRITRKPAQLLCEDLLTGNVVWNRGLEPGSMAVPLDGDTLGVVEPRGVLHVLSALDGSPRGEALTVAVPAALERVIVSRDAERWYVILSERAAQQAALMQSQVRQGYRLPIVTGPLYAIDRATVQVLWHADLDREGWPLDQPRSLPILVQAFQTVPAGFGNAGVPGSVLHLRDKRTGHDVLRRDDVKFTYTTVYGDPDRGIVDIHQQHESIRLRYQPAPPPPPLPVE